MKISGTTDEGMPSQKKNENNLSFGPIIIPCCSLL